MKKKKNRGNGTGTVYQLANGKWRAVVTLGYSSKGKRLTRSCSKYRTKKDALAAIPSLRKRSDYGAFTFRQAWQIVREQLVRDDLSKGKLAEYDNAWSRLAILHSAQISETRTADLQLAIDEVPGSFHPKKAAKNVLGHIYKFALANDIAPRNYISFVKLPPCPEPEKDAFEPAEVDRLWPVAEGGNRAAQYALVMIYCSMRPGELWAQETQKINLSEQYMIGGIKTVAGKNRVIPIADRLLPIFRQLVLAAKDRLLAWNEKTFYKRYYKALEEAEVRPLPPGCCRHTFATMSAEADLQPAVIQEIMGHKDYKTTIKNYTHIRTRKKIESVNKL